MERDDGGPAFPVMPPVDADGRSPSGYPFPDPGMTLRDYFAVAALQGMLAQARPGDGTPAEFAEDAYTFADAMLAARKKGPGA